MDRLKQFFLEALRAALRGQAVDWERPLSDGEWRGLFQLAQIHNVLPLVYEAVYPCPAARGLDPALLRPFKEQAIQTAVQQTVRTRDFLQLEQGLEAAGVTPLVVKGLICRELYPRPDLRPSGDEDILIPPGQFSACHGAMTAQGLEPLEPEQDMGRAHEVPYGKPGSPLRIELHKALFPPESEAYGEFNRFFDGVFDRAVTETVQGVPVPTLGYTDHFFYLICHAFKHFLHSGFGIRQVCDMVLFANAHGSAIDWTAILSRCRGIHAELFTAALLQIGWKYLNFDPERACYPAEWRAIQVDEAPLLEDLLSGGVYGAADLSRQHSSNITLNAVTARKKGRRSGAPVLKTLFPSAKHLERRYPYLKRRPYLLPAAWISRMVHYGKELKSDSDSRASAAIQIGNRRIELLRQYGVIR